MPDFPAIVHQREHAVVRVDTFEYFLPGLFRRSWALVNPFPLRSTISDALNFVFYIPSLVIYPLRRHLGSGVLIDRDGYLITNNHVIEEADKYTVHLIDSESVHWRFDAKVVGRDPHADIALLKIDPGKVPLVVAPLGDPDTLQLGDWIVAIGNPFNLTGSVSIGNVSGLHRQVGSNTIEDYIQVTAAVNPGNSGGPILNTRSEVVGIVALGIFPANNLGFAIPSSLVTPFLDNLKRTGRPRRGFLGVTVRDLTPYIAKEEGLDVTKGVLITEVSFFSPAGGADIEAGDILLSYNGKKVEKARDAQMAILLTLPGAEVPIVLRREGKLREVQVKIGHRTTPFRIF